MAGYRKPPKDEGVSSRRTREADRTPPKQPKQKKKPENPLSGFVPTFDSKTGTLVEPSNDPFVKARRQREQAASRTPARSREIVRRQRLLRAAGFKVVVDGIWGPISQRSWNEYLKRRQENPSAYGPLKGESGDSLAEDAERNRGDNLKAQQEAQTRIAAAREAKRIEAQRKARIAARASLLRENPQAARTMNLRQLADVILDPSSKMGLITEAGARATQVWLKSRGHKVNVSGRYDRATHDALERAFRRAADAERQRRVEWVKSQLYGRSGLRPGETHAWFPLNGGKIPTARELDRLIQAGGFSAEAALKAIVSNGINSFESFDQVRTADLMKLSAKLQPFGPKGNLAQQDDLLGMYGSILGITDLMPFEDTSEMTDAQRRFYLQQRANSPAIRGENAKRLGELRATVSALAQSSSPEDFAEKLAVYMRKAEEDHKRVQAELAKDIPWWGKAVQSVLAPGEFLRTAVVYDVMRGSQIVFGEDGERRVQWEDAQVALGRSPDTIPAYDGLVENQNALLTFGFELIADPLNFAHPFRTASTFIKAGTKGSTVGSYALRGSGIWQKALVYERGTWSKAEKLGRLDDFVFQGNAIHDTAAFQKVRDFGRSLTRLKEDAIAAAQDRVVVQIRHGFKKPVDPVAAKGWKASRPKNAAKVEKYRNAVKAWLDASPELRPLLAALRADRASLYVDSARTTYSNIGASILANLSEKARVAAIHQLATDSADDLALTLAERGLDDVALRLQLNEEYTRIVNEAGVYITGGRGSSELAKQVFGRTVSRMDDIEHVLLPSIQDLLEDDAALFLSKLAPETASAGADSLVHPLWDEGGLWRRRASETAETVRTLGRDTFDDAATVDVANPAFGIGHTAAEFHEAVEWEVRRRTPRVLGYASRNLKAGTLSDDFDVNAVLERERSDVIGAWKKRNDGLYYDTRETVKVSALYARQLTDAYDALLNSSREEQWGVGGVASPVFGDAANATVNPADEGLWKLSWTMGSRYSARPKIDHGTRRMISPEAPFGATRKEEIDFVQSEYERGRKLVESVSASKVALKEAADEVIVREFARDKLYLVALANAQSRYAKWAYRAIYGSLRVWIFATLPLRYGWVVRNVIDNFAKAMIKSVRDPRYIFLGAKHPGSGIRSIFELGIRPMKNLAMAFDLQFGTNVADHLQRLLDMFFELPSEVIGKVMKAHGLPPVPEMALDNARLQVGASHKLRGSGSPIRVTPEDMERAGVEAVGEGSESLAARLGGKIARGHDVLWELTANHPENYWKRVIYRSDYDRELKRALAAGADPVDASMLAHEKAWDTVTETLFDYSKITTAEDTLRVLFPFVQFWRKNTGFWAKSFTSKPWLTNAVLQFDAARQESHTDLPPWMRRYIHADEIVDAAAVVPGLDRVVDAMLPDNAQFDPLSFASFAPLYRAYRDGFYGDNSFLPGENAGLAILGPALDAMNDWGLSMNPLVRKPLEAYGVASERAWQQMFPQTALATALAREFISDSAALKVASWESAFDHLPFGVDSDTIAENFDFYVQQEMAGQVARGEPANREIAEATIRAWFLTQNVWGYFGGLYWRRATPEDMYIAKLQNDTMVGGVEFDDLSADDKRLLKLWSMRGADRLTYDRYVDMLPLIEAYFRTEDWALKDELLSENPGLRQYVTARSGYNGMPYSGRWLRNMRRRTETATFFKALSLIEGLDAPFDVREAAVDMFASKALREYWASNDTPSQMRDRFVKGEIHRYYDELNRDYFSIPDSDYAARDGFLAEHPEIVRYWNRNNDPADDFEAMLGSANAALREQYFAIVNSGNGENWAAAAALLKKHPFMFEDTKAAGKVDEATGEWKFGGGGGKNWPTARTQAYRKARPYLTWFFDKYMKKVGEDKAWAWLDSGVQNKLPGALIIRAYLDKYTGKKDWSAARLALFREARPHMRWFFEVLMKQVGEKKAWAWLEESDSDAAKLIKEYLRKYGKKSASSVAYLKAKPWLKVYYDMEDGAARAWLNGDSEGAKIVRDYFENHASQNGLSQHAKDYRAVKADLDYYGSLPKQQRAAWLNSSDPRAIRVLAFFKKYGKTHQYERLFRKYPALSGGTPEQRKRIEFWKALFSLPPDKRPGYIMEHAEDAGVFIYGEFGETERHDLEMEYRRRAVGLGLNEKQSAFLYVKPLLDFYRTLDPKDKPLFLRANPELQDYFDKYTTSSPTGDKRLDGLVEQYFSLPPNSLARSKFLRENPTVQDWFDDRGSPAEKAMRNLLEQYFAVNGRLEREQFLSRHPEVAAYFEQRRAEKSNESDIFNAFDLADPRLSPFFEQTEDMLRAAADMRDRLRRSALLRLQPDSIEYRRDRRSESVSL